MRGKETERSSALPSVADVPEKGAGSPTPSPATLTVPFPPSANSLFKNRKGGRAKTAAYTSWLLAASGALSRSHLPKYYSVPVEISLAVTMPDRRIRDLDNLVKPSVDLLVRHGIIEADDWRYVKCFNVYLVGIERPGSIDIHITPSNRQP